MMCPKFFLPNSSNIKAASSKQFGVSLNLLLHRFISIRNLLIMCIHNYFNLFYKNIFPHPQLPSKTIEQQSSIEFDLNPLTKSINCFYPLFRQFSEIFQHIIQYFRRMSLPFDYLSHNLQRVF